MLGMEFSRAREGLQHSLRVRVLVSILAIFAVVAIPAALGFGWIVDRTSAKLGQLYADKQVLYDRHRALEALMREIALAETLARSPAIVEWAEVEDDPLRRMRGLTELEHFRQTFRDRSYFMVIDGSGNYYFNDRDNSYAGAERRYTLDRANAKDQWYYSTMALGSGCHINVNNDDELSVTKVWINCVVRDANRGIGLIGTGIDLTAFLRDVVNSEQPGVETILIDRTGAIQAIRDRSRIDFHSLAKAADARKTIDQLVDTDSDRARLSTMLAAATTSQAPVETGFLEIDGRSMLVGVGYLEQLGWYNVTVMDVDAIIDRSLFLPLAILLGLVVLAAALLVTLLFKRTVLDRLAKAERAVARVEAGDFSIVDTDEGRDEIGRLARALSRMASAVHDHTATLENAVRERTQQLQEIADRDALTGILNRRGFTATMSERLRRAASEDVGFGLIVLDIDRFKAINDGRGHVAGDAVIREVARRLQSVLDANDVCGRWGGDEFILLLGDCDAKRLAEMAEKILSVLRGKPVALPGRGRVRLTGSAGGHLLTGADDIDTAVHRADVALYAAKRAGRNRWVGYDSVRHLNMSRDRHVA
jgi:diguanylate cyclase (GGDEF)-like protein